MTSSVYNFMSIQSSNHSTDRTTSRCNDWLKRNAHTGDES